jgi:hypothetical protein
MNELSKLQEQHTAGAQDLGYVYQFYYFVLLALELRQGQKIGFEVKDDIHIDREDETILFQTKHTIYENQNLTILDIDLWKTLSNWVEFIKKGDKNFLEKHSFILVTNKNDGNNEFIDTLSSFKVNQDIDTVLSKLKELKDRTKDETIKKYINNVISLGKQKIKQFIPKLSIEIVDDIIVKIKNKIIENTYQSDLVDVIFDSLYSNIQQAKYFDTRNNKKFEITCEDFARRFGRCFRVAFENKPLPPRNHPVLLPENLEDQIFIKQLLDIGEIDNDSPRILEYTTQMLMALNSFSYWLKNGYVLPEEMDGFAKNNILMWNNKFIEKYRQIDSQIKKGVPICDLEEDIKTLGIELVDFIRQKDLSILNYPALGLEISNGHFYALSDDLKIGWHYDWKNKYKKQ